MHLQAHILSTKTCYNFVLRICEVRGKCGAKSEILVLSDESSSHTVSTHLNKTSIPTNKNIKKEDLRVTLTPPPPSIEAYECWIPGCVSCLLWPLCVFLKYQTNLWDSPESVYTQLLLMEIFNDLGRCLAGLL